MEKEKVLIIKAGYAEFLESQSNSRRVSLGDILRVTPLLHAYEEDQVTWVSDDYAFPLLRENPLIDRLLPYDFTTAEQIRHEEFDTVINLEKVPGICALSDGIKAWKRYGFRFNSREGSAEAYERAAEVLAISSDPKNKKRNKKTCQELLFEMIGKEWDGEGYVLGYSPEVEEEFEIALNTLVGKKWPIKAWPDKKWDELEERLKKEGFRVTRQDKQGPEILNDLYGYMDWLASCKEIVTTDSLGAHLGLALNKKVICLFGPTPYQEYFFYGRGEAVLPNPIPECMPCFERECSRGRSCMEDISVERVQKKAKEWL